MSEVGFEIEGIVNKASLAKRDNPNNNFDGRLTLKISSDKLSREVNLPFNYLNEDRARLVEQALQGERVEYSYGGAMADMNSDHVNHRLSVKSGVLTGREYTSSEFVRV